MNFSAIKLCGCVALMVVFWGTPAMAQLRGGRGVSNATQAKQNEAVMKQARQMGMTVQQYEQWQMSQMQQAQAAQAAQAQNNAGGPNQMNPVAARKAKRNKAKEENKEKAGGAKEDTEEAENEDGEAKATSNKIPEPILVTGEELMTRDGVPLQATWFGSSRGKNATPVLLLSGVDRSRNDYRHLASFLQNQGFAVLAVDLRFAGTRSFMNEAEETSEEPVVDEDGTAEDATEEDAEGTTEETVVDEDATDEDATEEDAEGTTEEDAVEEPVEEAKSTKKPTKREDVPWDHLRSEDLELVVMDIETCRRWLAVKNNEEELNLNSLCIVASDAIGIAAIDWMTRDWAGELGGPQPPAFTAQTQKMGQQAKFSKAIVLLSPVEGLRGYDLCRIASEQETMEKKMPIMLFVGKENREDMKSASKIRKNFERARKQEEKLENKKDRTFFYWECNTDVTGSALLGAEEQLPGWIAQFFREKVASKKCPWNYVVE